MTPSWEAHAQRLADQLLADGHLQSPGWHAAVCAVPRHELVPRFYTQREAAFELVRPEVEVPREAWLDLVYSPTTLITAVLAGAAGRSIAVSSSTKPDLMVRMLEALDVHDSHRVLEIGTGSGYNAALLCHRLGAGQVFSVDLRPELVADARSRLATIGYEPTLTAADGSAGMPDSAPFDRVIATCSVARVPGSWIEQTAPGGIILVDVEGQLAAGNLVALRRGDREVAEGRFLPWYGRFMTMRRDAADAGADRPGTQRGGGTDRTTSVDPAELDGAFRFLAQYRLPSGTRHTLDVEDGVPTATCLTTDDSWCVVVRDAGRSGRHHVQHGGVRDLWAVVEAAHEEWISMGEPPWHRFGITATPDVQRVWLDAPGGRYAWELPG